jgi:DNA-binding transcriptional ArsR family regulator
VKPIKSPDDPRYVKAMSHPARARIMAMLSEREASPKELSDWLGITLGATAYHVRALHKLGLIELVGERRVRGAVEHYYRASKPIAGAGEDWLVAARAAVAAGGFDSPEAVIARAGGQVDERGFAALAAEARKFLARVERIEADAAKRLAKSNGAGAIDASVVVLAYEATPLAEQIPERPRKRTGIS